MIEPGPELTFWLTLFAAAQILYAVTFLVDLYIFTRPVNRVVMTERPPDYSLPHILLFYPVLHELEETMRTTFTAMSRLDYPPDRWRVTAIPNSDDLETIASLKRLQLEFSFLDIVEIPPTTHPSWNVVWDAWDANARVYWWHHGERAGNTDLPPKKTRQLIYAFYHAAAERAGDEDFLVSYTDADSCPPVAHFLEGAVGMQTYDVVQAENIAANMNASLAASWHAFDHMAWDGRKYRHLTANGTQPYWVLGKGLFFRASDLVALGGFHPWLAIEDPEVGMRFWAAGARLGVIEDPLIEEAPLTFGRGVTQRKRWVCGFFQSLGRPLDELGFTPVEKLKAWLNFFPCLSLWVNAVGFPSGVWAIVAGMNSGLIPVWLVALSVVNLTAFSASLTSLYMSTWKRTGLVFDRTSDRLSYMLKINPVFLMIWWVVWLVPLWLGFWMYIRSGGLVWDRTEKINANESLIRAAVPKDAAPRDAGQDAPAPARQDAPAAVA